MGGRRIHSGRFTRRQLLGRATALAGVPLALSVASRGQETTTTNTDGTLRLTLPERPEGFDPLDEVGSNSGLSSLIFGGLYRYGDSVELVPYLAAEEPTIEDDGRRYVVSIREDARFQNDDPVTAEDVRYSFEVGQEEWEDESWFPTVVDDVTAVDDRTIQFDLSEPYAPFPHLLTLDVVPKAIREDDPDQFDTRRPVGTGPFRVVARQADDPLRLNRWDDYWSQPSPLLAAVEVDAIDTPTSRLNALQSGETDVIGSIPAELYSDVEDLENAAIVEQPAMEYVYLGFNCEGGPTADPRVREAIDYCVSLDRAVADFVEPAGVRQHSPLPPPLAAEWEFPVDEWRSIPHDRDIDAARELFDEAETPDDWRATIAIPDDEISQQLAVAVANGMNEAGYPPEVRTLDAPSVRQAGTLGDPETYDVFVGRWSAVPDPDGFTYPLFARSAEGETNATFYRNETVEENLEDARRTTDRSERRELYAEAVTTVLTDRVHLPVFDRVHSFAVRESIRDFQAHPVESFRLVSDENNVSIVR